MRSNAILLVEDNPDDIELTKRAFAKAKIQNELIIARDGQQAIDLLFRDDNVQPIRPVVTLLDLSLPKIGGLEVLSRIRKDNRTKHLPVVVLTSSNESADLFQSYDLGVNSYIRKPVEFNQFVEAVSTLQLYWIILNEPPPEAE
ncbi:MAG: response regulator [Alphaproteobacteria bacterium]|nr:response regulator [Alphaproteobacteria bacterium]